MVDISATPDTLAARFPNFMAAVAGVQSSTRNGSWALLGDSLAFGVGATTRLKGLPQALVDELTSRNIPAECDSLWGYPPSMPSAALAAYDSRFTYSGASWSPSNVSINAQMFNNNSDTVDWIAYTADKQINLFDIWYPVDGQFGSFSVSVDDGATQTINQQNRFGVWTWSGTAWTQTTAPPAVSQSFGYARLVMPTGNHTIKIRRVSGNIQISGVHGYRSDVFQLGIYNWGRSGATSSDWKAGTNYWNYLGAMGQVLKPDLTTIELGKNDENTGVLPSLTQSNLASLYAVVQTAPAKDLAAIVTTSSLVTAIPQATQDATRAAVKAAAAAAGVPVLASLPVRLGEYADANPRGLYNDSTHLSNLGYRAKARALCNLLLAA